MPSTTPNFGFEYPLSSDNLSDGAQSIQDFATTADTTFVDLKGGTTGQYLAKTTNTDMDFTWTTLPTVPDAFPVAGSTYYVSNRNFTFHDALDVEQPVSQQMTCLPVFFGSTVTLDRLAIEVTTAQASTTVRLGIYDNDGTNGAPGTLLVDGGTVATATLGVKEVTISQQVSGLVYFAFASAALTPATFRCVSRSGTGSVPWQMFAYSTVNTDPFATSPTMWRRVGVTGAFPTPAGATLIGASQQGSIIVAGRVA